MKHGDLCAEEVLTLNSSNFGMENYKCILGYSPCSKSGAWLSLSTKSLKPEDLDTTLSVLYAVSK